MIMIDIETLGTATDTVILSIGAVEFDKTGLGSEFYQVLNVQNQIDTGRSVTMWTIAWWMKQSKEAQSIMSDDVQDGADYLASALAELEDAFEWKDTQVWCYGLNFDVPILDHAYQGHTPWEFRNTRCLRTILGDLPEFAKPFVRVKPTLAHNALEDAKAQALTLINIWNLPPGSARV